MVTEQRRICLGKDENSRHEIGIIDKGREIVCDRADSCNEQDGCINNPKSRRITFDPKLMSLSWADIK